MDGWMEQFGSVPEDAFFKHSSVCARIYYVFFLETQYVAQSILTTHT